MKTSFLHHFISFVSSP